MARNRQARRRAPGGVGVSGFGWMGNVHSRAYARVRHRSSDLGVLSELVVVADDVPGRAAEAVQEAAVQSAVGLNYRNAPAVALARRLIAAGERPRLARRRPGPLPARGHRLGGRRRGGIHPGPAPATGPTSGHVSTVHVGPGDGDLAAFQPGAGMAMGYDDLKVIAARDFVCSIAEGRWIGIELADAVRRGRPRRAGYLRGGRRLGGPARRLSRPPRTVCAWSAGSGRRFGHGVPNPLVLPSGRRDS